MTVHCVDVLRADGGVPMLDALDLLSELAVCVVGLLGDQAACREDAAAAERVMRTNHVGRPC